MFRGGSNSLAVVARRLLSSSPLPAPPTISVKKALDYAPSAAAAAPLVRVQGWVRSVRRQKQLAFIELCDGSTSSAIQLVLPPSALPPELYMGSSVTVRSHPCTLRRRAVVTLCACHRTFASDSLAW